jgi:hypothetical protein
VLVAEVVDQAEAGSDRHGDRRGRDEPHQRFSMAQPGGSTT